LFEGVLVPKNAGVRRVFAVTLLLLLVVAIVLVGFLAARKPAAWFSVVADGNGYDALVQAAGQMKGRLSEDEAKGAEFVKANERMFELVSAALKLPFEVPASMYSLTNSLLSDLASFKAIGVAIRASGKEAEERGANAEAVTNYTSIIQLGQRVEHGPIIALLVGIALEKIGLDALEKVAVTLTPAQRKELADRIELFDRERLAFSEVAVREEHYARQVAGNPLKMLVARFYIRSVLIKAEQRRDNLSSDLRRVSQKLRSD
jgi:hypothetical protein